ncbi:hypothetical protein [uncultured Winogradskyella sp.]|uniref:tetratricopeptide repeat protein n=1 Tax=Winogradskyella sp. 4-2091 TaxID=3381659 RepID=UPI002619EE05|nr:hypothetical protein [uncultured Winogradskyella sp.]
MKREEFIAHYFDGTLNTKQKALFIELMTNDNEFKKQVEFEEQTKTAIISVKKDELKQKLELLESPKKQFKFYAIAIAASLIIALGIFSLLQPSNRVTNEQLFANYFEPYPNIISPASRGNQTKNAKIEAFNYYDAKNYNLASQKFEALYKSTNTPYYLFYHAICQLQLGKTDSAITLLKKREGVTDKLKMHTNWYLALAYLKTNNTTEAKILLQIISAENSFKHKAAKDILKKIK